MKLSIVILSTFIPFFVFSQSYEAVDVEFKNDPLVDTYFADKDEEAQYNKFMKEFVVMGLTGESPFVGMEVKEDTLYYYPLDEKQNAEKLPRTGKKLYQKQEDGPFAFMRVDLSGKSPILYVGQYAELEEPSGKPSRTYEKLKKKYGDQVEVKVAIVHYRQIDEQEIENPLELTKAFKVTDVDLVVNQEIMDFGLKYYDKYLGFVEGQEATVEDTYRNSQFLIDIEFFRKVSIRSYQSENATFSFSGNLEKPEEDIYRVKKLKSYWDFHVKENAEDPFEVEKLEYTTFYVLKEKDKDKPEYEALKEKYGDYVPVNTIIQTVEEIPLENN